MAKLMKKKKEREDTTKGVKTTDATLKYNFQT